MQESHTICFIFPTTDSLSTVHCTLYIAFFCNIPCSPSDTLLYSCTHSLLLSNSHVTLERVRPIPNRYTNGSFQFIVGVIWKMHEWTQYDSIQLGFYSFHTLLPNSYFINTVIKNFFIFFQFNSFHLLYRNFK